MAGAPTGNKNATRGRRWRDAIETALESHPDEPDYTDCSKLIAGLRRAAHAYVKKMMAENDISFFREFGDRIDGKPQQAIVGEGDGPVHFESVVRQIVDPKA